MGAKISAISILLLFLPFMATLTAKDDPRGEALLERLGTWTEHTAEQKAFLHLDKSSYQAGQTIWFKAYLLDAVSHKPVPGKNNLYVELLNTDGRAMAIRLLLASDGVAKGDIRLDSNIPDGNYVLRAFSGWMRNSGEENYFSRDIYISNHQYENIVPRMEVFRNRIFNWRLGRLERNYDVAFFPEGGNLVAGIPGRIAFRAYDQLGNGQKAEGRIVDRAGNTVAVLETGDHGIGVAEFEPLRGEEYEARISVNGGRKNTYDLPRVSGEGYAMRIDQDESNIIVQVDAKVSPQHPLYSEDVIIIGHTRGKPVYAGSHLLANGNLLLELDAGLFPSGIAHFTVFAGGDLPVAERLVFVDRGDGLVFTPVIGASSVDGDNYIDLQISVSDQHGNPVSGNFSLSAVSGIPDEASFAPGILSYLLFSSDLKGMTGDPLLYLQEADDRPAMADKLLMTYGWRRFNWDEVISGELPENRYSGEPGLTVAGRLIDPSKDVSLNNYPVRLMIRSGHDDLYETETTRNGIFAFSELFYEGEVRMELSSRRLPGNYPPEFDLTVQSARDYDYEPGMHTREHSVTARGDNWSRDRTAGRSPYSSAQRRETSPRVYGVPDQTIYIDYETSTERSLFEVLRNRATGMQFDGGRIIIRGPSSIYGANEARFMLDGMFVGRDAFLGLYPREIERIEIFRGTSAAIFGVRGGTGVILAYTRRPGYTGLEDILELSMLGYHEAREFYSDRVLLPGTRTDDAAEVTIYWEPGIVTGPKGTAGLRLPVREGVDRLIFTIQGTGHDGSPGYSTFTLDID